MSLEIELARFYKIYSVDSESEIVSYVPITGFSFEKIEELVQKCKIIDPTPKKNNRPRRKA